MKSFLLSALVSFSAAAAAHAADIQVTPVVPVDCQQKQPKNVTWVAVQAGQANGTVAFDLTLTHGTCRLGVGTIQPIASDFNFYLVSQEYSRDFQSDYALSSPTTLSARMSLTPSEFFAITNVRHFTLSFYPNSGETSYNWRMEITRDPATNGVSFRMTAI